MKTLLQYIKGVKKGKQAHDLEKEAMQDPFLNDALEGYDTVKGTHFDNIVNLQQRILSKTKKKKTFAVYSVAASILLLVSTGVYFYLQSSNNNSSQIAYKERNEEKNTDLNIVEEKKEIANKIINKNNSEKESTSKDLPLLASVEKKHASHKSKIDAPIENIGLQKIVLDSDINFDSSEIQSASMMAANAQILNEELKEEVSQAEMDRLLAVKDHKKTHEILEKNNNIIQIESSTQENRRNKQSFKISSDASRMSVSGKVILPESLPLIGKEKYNEYLKNNIEKTEDNNCHNKNALISFQIDSTGTPKDIQIIKSICPEIDSQLIQLIEKGSKWTEGIGNLKFEY